MKQAKTSKIIHYVHLMRLHKPIGTLLLLWPTLWGLWLANAGMPPISLLLIFVLGAFLMRSAGCIVNDIADRHFDGRVARTHLRPLAQGVLSPWQALWLAVLLALLAFLLVWQCNWLTVQLALVAVVIAVIYPFLKRITHFPQLGLGVAFSFGVPMAFAASNNTVSMDAWFVFAGCLLWPVIYDTMYAMVDREDDIKIGIKSTAILFASHDCFIIALLQYTFILWFALVGLFFHLQTSYYICLLLVNILFVYQQWLIKERQPERCMRAFVNNNWVGFIIFLGICLSVPQ